MNRWYNTPAETKIRAYTQIAEDTGMAAYAVEKDWWVVQTLALIFEMEIGNHLVFKGGTSLSKAWGLIDRFSEDIDLALDRKFLGVEGNLSKSKRTALRKSAYTYISTIFIIDLQHKFSEKGFSDVILKLIETPDSDQDPSVIEIYYPNVIPTPGYIQPKVQVEIGCRSLREPFTNKNVLSLVDENYPQAAFAQASINIPVVNPERTFLEKIFLLHEEFHRPAEKARVNRLSRHLYDVYQLSKNQFALDAINDKVLYETIVNHRYHFTKVGGVDYNLHQPQSINPIPNADFIEAWRADYKIMQQQMIYGDSPSFDEIIDTLTEFKNTINDLKWTFETQFPLPTINHP